MAAALAGLALIVIMVYCLIRAGKKIITQTFGGKNYMLSALFLDVQTSSYSLSKCQFYAWTADSHGTPACMVLTEYCLTDSLLKGKYCRIN